MEEKVILEASHVAKTFFSSKGDTDAIEDVSIQVRENEFLVLLGPGQCGKTTFLNILAGLVKPTSGSLKLDGREIAGRDQRIAMVFQKTGLYRVEDRHGKRGARFEIPEGPQGQAPRDCPEVSGPGGASRL